MLEAFSAASVSSDSVHTTPIHRDRDRSPRIYTQSWSAMLRSTNPEFPASCVRITSHPVCKYLTHQLLFDRIYEEIRTNIGDEAKRNKWSVPDTVYNARIQSIEYMLLLMDGMEELLSKVSM